jgi:hypothetical protein
MYIKQTILFILAHWLSLIFRWRDVDGYTNWPSVAIVSWRIPHRLVISFRGKFGDLTDVIWFTGHIFAIWLFGRHALSYLNEYDTQSLPTFWVNVSYVLNLIDRLRLLFASLSPHRINISINQSRVTAVPFDCSGNASLTAWVYMLLGISRDTCNMCHLVDATMRFGFSSLRFTLASWDQYQHQSKQDDSRTFWFSRKGESYCFGI